MNGVTVIMPTYNQGDFIVRAINSLKLQTFERWELIIVNDDSDDDTESILLPILQDKRIKYYRNTVNKGLGACINFAFQLGIYDLVTYLPSDDIYYSNHLESLYKKFIDDDIFLACSGLLHYYNETLSGSLGNLTLGKIPNSTYQLVQVMHKKTDQKWIERQELVTADLDIMFWDNVSMLGKQVETGIVSAEWVSHPKQRHKIISELYKGGISKYKHYYKVKEPIVFVGSGNFIDESIIPAALDKYKVIESNNALKILIIGELAFNPERISAFEQQGHKLYGLWIEPSGFLCNVGPFYFSNIQTLSSTDEIDIINPDIIYGLLNYASVPLAHSILVSHPHIPFVWHFKESPFLSRQYGQWDKLIDLYRKSDGQIYINSTIKLWFDQITGNKDDLYIILDGDLPKKDWFKDNMSERISLSDGAFHTVVPGRPYGIHPDHVALLASQNIHLHFYGNFQQNIWHNWINETNLLAPGYLHIHDNCESTEWASEFSKYDAGWLHIFDSFNYGELMKLTWNELNYPARIPTLAAAGLPMLYKNNEGHICATQELMTKLGTGIPFDSFLDIGDKLSNIELMEDTRKNVLSCRNFFAFDTHIENIICFFKKVIKKKSLREGQV